MFEDAPIRVFKLTALLLLVLGLGVCTAGRLPVASMQGAGSRACGLTPLDAPPPTGLGHPSPVSSADAGDDLELASHVAGRTFEVYAEGGYAYMAEGPALVVLDVSDPTQPVEVGRLLLPRVVRQVEVRGDYAYVVTGYGGFHVVSLADRTNPTEIGRLETSGFAYQLDVSGGYAYVTEIRGPLRVISIADKAEPTQVGFLKPTWSATSVRVVGDYAYVTAGVDGLRVVSLADKSSPSEVGALDTPETAQRLAIVGEYAYVADVLGGLRVVSIADRENPQEVASLESFRADYLDEAGDYVYVGNG